MQDLSIQDVRFVNGGDLTHDICVGCIGAAIGVSLTIGATAAGVYWYLSRSIHSEAESGVNTLNISKNQLDLSLNDIPLDTPVGVLGLTLQLNLTYKSLR